MLDVHPPHSKIHGVGEFFLHLFTITIGLLIALGLEACAERFHHRHLRDEAESRLNQEIRDNRSQLASSQKSAAGEEANLIQAMHFLEAREANKPFDISHISLAFALTPLSDSSWRTASATGALSFMEYDQAQRYATAYHVQEQFAALQQESLDAFLQLNSYLVDNADPTKMSAKEAATAMVDVRHAYAHLQAMEEIGKGLGTDYGKAISAQ